MIVGVVPAAGRAARLAGVIEGSKELVPVGGRPAIQRLLERMEIADEIHVVVRPEKRDLIEHLAGTGARIVTGRPATVAESIALGLVGTAAGDTILVGFPDTLFEPADAFPRLVAEARPPWEVVLGLFRFPEPSRSDVVEADAAGIVRAVHVRPSNPPADVVWGCLAVRRGALAGVEGYDEPGRLFAALAAQGKVRAIRFPGQLVDLGTPEALARHADLEAAR